MNKQHYKVYLGWAILALWVAVFLIARFANSQTARPMSQAVTGIFLTSTVQLSPTPSLRSKTTPKLASTLVPTSPTPNMPVQIEPFSKEKLEDWLDLNDWRQHYELTQPGTWRTSTYIPIAGKPILLSFGWCVKEKSLLRPNRDAIQDYFFVNGTSIPKKYFSYREFNRCFFYQAIVHLKPEIPYTFVYERHHLKQVDDGWNKYPKGIYRYEITVRQASQTASSHYLKTCRQWLDVTAPTNWHHIYCDDMNGDFNVWGDIPSTEYGQYATEDIYFSNGNLVWNVYSTETGIIHWRTPRITRTHHNLLFSIEGKLLDGDPVHAFYHLDLYNINTKEEYRFAVRTNGQYSLWYVKDDSVTPLRDWTKTSYVRERNRLTVLVKDGQITFFLNGHPLEKVKTSHSNESRWLPFLAVEVDKDYRARYVFDRMVYVYP